MEPSKFLRLLMAIDECKASEMVGENVAEISVEGIVSIYLLFIEKLGKILNCSRFLRNSNKWYY